MTKTIITAAAALLLSIAGTACQGYGQTPALPQHPAIEANDLGEFFAPAAADAVVVWPNDGQPHGNIEPPTRLDIAATERAECDDMGGTWAGSPDATSGTLATCQGVDY